MGDKNNKDYFSLLNESDEIAEEDEINEIMKGMGVNKITAQAFYDVIHQKNLLSYDEVTTNLSAYYDGKYAENDDDTEYEEEDSEEGELTEGNNKNNRKNGGKPNQNKKVDMASMSREEVVKNYSLYTSQANKDVKSQEARMSQEDKVKFKEERDEVLYTIIMNLPLPKPGIDHALKGNLKGFRDYHLHGDLLLVYAKDLKTKVVSVARVCTHAQLGVHS